MKPAQYIQCRLTRPSGRTQMVMTIWIEARGAKKGAQVELLPSRELWTVVEVYGDVSVDHDKIKDMEANYRAGLPSTRDTTKDKRKRA